MNVVVISDGENFKIGGYSLEFLNMNELPKISNFFKSETIDNLYQNRDQDYLYFLNKFKNKYSDYDIIICDQINPFHPEWLLLNFPNTIKIYGMIDDPVCTYHRTLSSIWAFDGVFYVSPSYSEFLLTRELLSNYNSKISSHFLPHARQNILTDEHFQKINSSFENRSGGILYVGAYYESKIDRLIRFKEEFKKDFDVFGYWPYFGFRGLLRALELKNFYGYRVKSLTENQKFIKYMNYKICLNFNWNASRETGNMRMYQATFNGMMLLNDISAKSGHFEIYKEDEAVFFDGIEDAIEKAKYYLKNDNARIKIAKKGFERAVRDYNSEKVWIDLLTWASSIKMNLS